MMTHESDANCREKQARGARRRRRRADAATLAELGAGGGPRDMFGRISILEYFEYREEKYKISDFKREHMKSLRVQ